MTESVPRSGYGVKLVRGPFLRLPPHRNHVEQTDDLLALVQSVREKEPETLFAADLFGGGGGLSLGLQRAGFNVILGADHYTEAVETHGHHFPGMSLDWDLAEPDRVEAVAALIKSAGVSLVAGGPPCQPFSKAGRSMIRHRVRHAQRDPHDVRRDLWRSFLEVVRLSMPRAVLMENVPDMALDKEMFILRAMVEDLEQLGYSVEERVIDTWRYGVPQFRQRLILVAMRDSKGFEWPVEATERATVWNAIGDMPPVEGGWRPRGGADGWSNYNGPITSFQKTMREGILLADQGKLFDHITRPVRDDDARAFEFMDSTTKYSQLPDDVKRYRDDIFDDKYKRLDENDVSRTITAHIAKDGYWYIHPRQGRTLTVREAARLQTFPDRYRFAGPPSAAFKQIGNAVPPLLGQHLGMAIYSALRSETPAPSSSRELAAALSGWFNSRTQLRIPWLRAPTRWQVVAAEMVLDRADYDHVRITWPIFQALPTPEAVRDQGDALRQVAASIGREKRVVRLLEMADWLTDHPDALEEVEVPYTAVPNLTEAVANLALLTVPLAGEDASEEPVLVTKGVLRVASRFWCEPVDRKNKQSDGRLAVARLVGGGSTARAAHLGLIELANSLCRPVDPLCVECPLAADCRSSRTLTERAGGLF